MVSDLVGTSILGVIAGIMVIAISIMQAYIALDRIGHSYVLTTLDSYPDELAEFGRVLRVDRDVAEKVLMNSTRMYANLSTLPDATILIRVAGTSVKHRSVHIYVEPLTICLGEIEPRCLAFMELEQRVVLFNDEDVGYVKNTKLEAPEITSMILETNNIDAEQVISDMNRLKIIGIVIVAVFAFIGFTGIILSKQRVQNITRQTTQ